jgi:hypothetical protein
VIHRPTDPTADPVVVLDHDGTLENGRVQWFDLSGTLLGVRTYGGQFYNIVFDSTGEMWAADAGPRARPAASTRLREATP